MDFRANGCECQWEVDEAGRMERWEGWRFLVLFKGGEHRVSPGFYLFVSDVNQGNKGVV